MENYAVYKTKVGYVKIGYESDYVTHLLFVKDAEDFGVKNEFTDYVFDELCAYLDKKRVQFTFKYRVKGTDFQKKVWDALCNIPYGETRTYKDIAQEIGNTKACRAVGGANNKNPIMIVVPCHRVIGSSNKLVGYAGGLDVKQFLLDLESGK